MWLETLFLISTKSASNQCLPEPQASTVLGCSANGTIAEKSLSLPVGGLNTNTNITRAGARTYLTWLSQTPPSYLTTSLLSLFPRVLRTRNMRETNSYTSSQYVADSGFPLVGIITRLFTKRASRGIGQEAQQHYDKEALRRKGKIIGRVASHEERSAGKSKSVTSEEKEIKVDGQQDSK